MNKNKAVLSLAGFVLVAAMAITAQAAPPSNNCPSSYDIVHVNDAVNRFTARQVDKVGNHNKLVCEKTAGPNVDYVDDL
jgi:hypothetical protein